MDTALLFFIPLAALVLDLLLGDPQRIFHPVQLLGKALDWEERTVRKFMGKNLKAAGILCLVVNVVVVFHVVNFLVDIPYLGWAIFLYFAYSGLALGQLLKEGKQISHLLDQNDLERARNRIGQLVSRDTDAMDENDMRKALAETLSENFNDGFIAPAFFLLLGGPALMWTYKMVSTMDSMWGYRNERFEKLGWAGAKGDDILAYIPARLSALFLAGGAWLVKRGKKGLAESIMADAAKMKSPNAGWPMATAAWLCSASMGGRTKYDGEFVEKPHLGPEQGVWDHKTLSLLLRLLMVSGIAGFLLMHVYFFLIRYAAF